jgi:TP901 family phage tail tape measure protein
MSISIGILKGYLQLEDNFSNPMLNAEKRFSAAVNNITKAGEGIETVGKGLTVVGAAFAALAVAGVNASQSLNNSLGNLQSIVGGPLEESTQKVVGLKKELQTLGPDVGKGVTDLSEGFYELQSSLGDTGENMKLLEINAKAARAGMASTQDAIKFTTAVTKTYGDTTAEATQKVVDLGFQAVNIGQTTFPELAAAIGGVAPLAKETGVSLEEMFAVLATATGVTGNTNEVITQMASAITAVVSPSKDMAEAYEAMGVKSGEALIKQRGLVGALQDIAAQAKAADKPLIDLVGRKEAWIIASSLAGSQAENFSKNLGKMGEAAGATDKAFEAQTQGINKAGFMWDQFKVKLEVVAQRYGDKLIPILVRFGEAMLPVLDMVLKGIELFDKLPQPIQTVVIVLGGLAVATGPAVYGLGKLVTAFGEVAGERGLKALTREAPNLIRLFVDVGTGSRSLTSVFGSLGSSVSTLGGNFSKLISIGGSVTIFVGAALEMFRRAQEGIDEYGKTMQLATDKVLIMHAAQKLLGREATSFTEAWNIVRADVDKAAKSTGGLNSEMTELKQSLDRAIPYMTDTAAKNGLIAGQVQLASQEINNQTKAQNALTLSRAEDVVILDKSLKTGIDYASMNGKVVESLVAARGRGESWNNVLIQTNQNIPEVVRKGELLTFQLAEMNKVVDSLTSKQKEQLDAALKMGKNSDEAAKAVNSLNMGVKLTAQTVDLYKNRLSETVKHTKDLDKETDKAREAMIDIRADINKVGEALDKLVKEQEAAELAFAEKSVDAILAALDAKKQAEEAHARNMREMTMGELEFKLDAIFREGEARKKAITAVGQLANDARLAIDKEISSAMQKAVKESGNFQTVLNEIGQNVPTIFQPLIGILSNIGIETDKTTKKTKDWKDGVKDLASAFSNLAQSGGPLGGFGEVAAQVVGAADIAIQSFDRVKQGLDDLADKAKGSIATAFADIATGMISGVGAMMSATDPSKGAMSRILGGAVTGAALGLGVAAAVAQFSTSFAAAGPWAMAAGAVIGIFVGVFRGRAARREMEIVGQEWGQDISKGLFEKITKSMQFGGDRVANSIFNLKDFISEAGGLDSSNIDRFMGKLRDVFVMVETKQFTVAEAQRVLNGTFRDFAQVSLDSGKIASAQLQEIIRLNTEMGVNAAAVIEFVAGQATRASAGLVAIGAPVFTEIDKWHQSVTETEAKLKELSEAGKEGTKEWLDQQAKLTMLSAEHSYLVAKNAGDLDNLGIVAMAAYGAALKSGVGYVAAIRAAGPALDSVIKSQEKLGITSENEALKGLLAFRQKVAQNEELVGAAEALNDTLLAVSHTTGLNAASLNAMGDLGMSTFNRLIGAGFTQNEALRFMGDFLDNIKKGHIDLNVPIGDNTQKLLDMAAAEGIVKTKSTDLKDVFTAGTDKMVDAIDRLIKTLDKVPNSVDGIGKAIDRVPKQVRVDWEFNIPDMPGLTVEPRESNRTGSGGLHDYGQGTLAMLHGKEAVLTESQYNQVMGPDQHAFGSGIVVSQYNDFRGAFTDDLAGQQRFLKKIETAVVSSAEMRRALGINGR